MSANLRQLSHPHPFTAKHQHQPKRVALRANCRAQHAGYQPCISDSSADLSRRQVFLGSIAASTAVLQLSQPDRSEAFVAPPDGFRVHVDKLDGYYFLFPTNWTPVTTSGNDVFYRNPLRVDTNLFVDLSSPSSSRYSSVEDLGPPEAAAQRLLDQYLNKEFMSTRIGIRREGQIVSASSRVAPDGKLYYDIDIELKSFGSTNPYTVTQAEVLDSYKLEWERHLLTTLGVSNKRLYEFRLQADNTVYQNDSQMFSTILNSFRCKEVEQK